MRYIFLTACRNEERILEEFLKEFDDVIRSAGVFANCVLYVVDDLSTDRSVKILEKYQADPESVPLRIILAPTNLGNQGALFYALSQLDVSDQDVLVTFDCDGEDDVRQIPSILDLGKANPGKLVLIERGRRHEPLLFRILFNVYKLFFRFLTRQTTVPNNFMFIPCRYLPHIRKAPLAAVHFAYAVLKINFPRVTAQRDRRRRYGGQSSQNLFMIGSHGLVGLMVFYENVIAKLLLLLMCFGIFSLGIAAAAFVIPDTSHGTQRALLWLSGATAGIGIGLMGLMLASALALIFKLGVFTLSRLAVEEPQEPTRLERNASEERGVVRSGRSDIGAS